MFPIASNGFSRASRWLVAACVAAQLVAGCGGASDPPAATTPDAAMGMLRAKAKVLAQASSPAQLADQLFDLAEAAYPGVFPGHPSTGAAYGFYYRYYPTTGVIFGVVYDASFGYELNSVYATGGLFGGGLTYGGPIAQYLPPPAPPVPPLIVGELPFNIAYAATSFGIDGRSAPATFASNNTLNGYNFSAQEAPQIGTLSAVELEGTQTVQIGRWTNGTFAGKFYSVIDDTHSLSLNSNQGFHYAIATVFPNSLPCSGSKTYALAASTRPTKDDGTAATGSVDSVTATVTFNGAAAAPTVALSGTVNIDGQPRTFSGTQTNGLGNNTFALTNITSQTPGVGEALVRGTFGGANSAQMGIVLSGLRVGANSLANNVYFAARLSQTQSTAVACN
ncbi:MAG: hypothetical protein H7255_07565 [Ramlibacter sp.]|nr:hypothetical protein [Ramlibacter sp.]